MNPTTYRARLHSRRKPMPTLEYLAHLQMQHLLTVPFENLSVMAGATLQLTPAALFHKIVTHRRGGFCYELNGLFATLLAESGFVVERLSAQVYNAHKLEFGPPFDHMALCVRIAGTPYLVDVGFGDSFRHPIPLPHGTTRDVSGVYRVRPANSSDNLSSSNPAAASATTSPDHNATLLLETEAKGEWMPQYRFTMRPHGLEDFAPMCRYQSQDRNSGFTRGTVCTIATPKGRFTLRNDRLIITRGDKKLQMPIVAPSEYDRILQAYFGVSNNRRRE